MRENVKRVELNDITVVLSPNVKNSEMNLCLT